MQVYPLFIFAHVIPMIASPAHGTKNFIAAIIVSILTSLFLFFLGKVIRRPSYVFLISRSLLLLSWPFIVFGYS